MGPATLTLILSFVDPRQSFGPDKVIPPSVLSNAKGLAIITVLKVTDTSRALTSRPGSYFLVELALD